jgi:hypothetical protein
MSRMRLLIPVCVLLSVLALSAQTSINDLILVPVVVTDNKDVPIATLKQARVLPRSRILF